MLVVIFFICERQICSLNVFCKSNYGPNSIAYIQITADICADDMRASGVRHINSAAHKLIKNLIVMLVAQLSCASEIEKCANDSNGGGIVRLLP